MRKLGIVLLIFGGNGVSLSIGGQRGRGNDEWRKN